MKSKCMTHAVLHFWHWQHILWEWVVTTLLRSGNLTLLKTVKLCSVCGWKIMSQSKFGLITLTKQWYITIYCEKNRKIKSFWWFHSKFNCNIKIIILMWQNDINKKSLKKIKDMYWCQYMWEDNPKISGKFTMSWS